MNESKKSSNSSFGDSQESTYSNKSDKNQRRLNPSNPTTGRVIAPKEDSDDESSQSDNNDSVESNDVEDVSHLHTGWVNKDFVYGLLLSFVKHSKLSTGVDFCRVMCYQKSTNKLTESEKLHQKKMISLKKIISTMALKACRIKELAKYLDMPKIHLDTLPGYMAISSIIVGVLVDILSNTCGYRNVDHGDIRDYFHARFTNERNQRNYKRKPKEINTSSMVDGVSSALPTDSNDAVSSRTVSSAAPTAVIKKAPASTNPRPSAGTKKSKPHQAATGESVKKHSRHKAKEANSTSNALAAIEDILSEPNESANEYATGNEGLEDDEGHSNESSANSDSSSDGECIAFTWSLHCFYIVFAW